MSATTLRQHRVYYANRQGQIRTGIWNGFNCWGATLFVLGFEDKLKWVEVDEMSDFLSEHTTPIYRPMRKGDILAVRWRGVWLKHTAVYIGNGKYFHKRGGQTAEITDLKGVKATYGGTYSWHRVIRSAI